MSTWSNEIELRDENGEVRAFRANTGQEITIPKFPKPEADIQEWMDFMTLDALEAFRQVYLDKWTWESDREEYRDMVEMVSAEIEKRAIQVWLQRRKP